MSPWEGYSKTKVHRYPLCLMYYKAHNAMAVCLSQYKWNITKLTETIAVWSSQSWSFCLHCFLILFIEARVVLYWLWFKRKIKKVIQEKTVPITWFCWGFFCSLFFCVCVCRLLSVQKINEGYTKQFQYFLTDYAIEFVCLTWVPGSKMGFNVKNSSFPVNRAGFTVLSTAKLSHESMLRKGIFLNAKASAPDFWGVTGDCVSSQWILCTHWLWHFTLSLSWGLFIARILLNLMWFNLIEAQSSCTFYESHCCKE